MEVVGGWYSEVEGYDWAQPERSKGTGHFTQVVWAGSTQIGCAMNRDAAGYYIVVCQYAPAGNIRTRFHENVPRPVSEGPWDPLPQSKPQSRLPHRSTGKASSGRFPRDPTGDGARSRASSAPRQSSASPPRVGEGPRARSRSQPSHRDAPAARLPTAAAGTPSQMRHSRPAAAVSAQRGQAPPASKPEVAGGFSQSRSAGRPGGWGSHSPQPEALSQAHLYSRAHTRAHGAASQAHGEAPGQAQAQGSTHAHAAASQAQTQGPAPAPVKPQAPVYTHATPNPAQAQAQAQIQAQAQAQAQYQAQMYVVDTSRSRSRSPVPQRAKVFQSSQQPMSYAQQRFQTPPSQGPHSYAPPQQGFQLPARAQQYAPEYVRPSHHQPSAYNPPQQLAAPARQGYGSQPLQDYGSQLPKGYGSQPPQGYGLQGYDPVPSQARCPAPLQGYGPLPPQGYMQLLPQSYAPSPPQGLAHAPQAAPASSFHPHLYGSPIVSGTRGVPAPDPVSDTAPVRPSTPPAAFPRARDPLQRRTSNNRARAASSGKSPSKAESTASVAPSPTKGQCAADTSPTGRGIEGIKLPPSEPVQLCTLVAADAQSTPRNMCITRERVVVVDRNLSNSSGLTAQEEALVANRLRVCLFCTNLKSSPQTPFCDACNAKRN